MTRTELHRTLDRAWLLRKTAAAGLMRWHRGALGDPAERESLMTVIGACSRVLNRYANIA